MRGPNAKKIIVTSDNFNPMDHGLEEAALLTPGLKWPTYYKRHIPGQNTVYRVNRPFVCMTAAQPAKMCEVVSMDPMHVDDKGLPLCALCYTRSFANGPADMAVETDDDDDV